MPLKEDFEKNKDSLKDSLEKKKDAIQDSIEEKTNSIKDGITEKKDEISESISAGVKKTVSFTKRLLWSVFFIGLLIGAAYMFWCNMTYSDGTRTGYLVKVSEKGYIFKTMEGEMNMGGLQEGDNTTLVAPMWYFSVADETIYEKLIQLQGKKLMLYYKEKNRAMPWQGESDYFIYKIEEK